jgi:ribonuclease III
MNDASGLEKLQSVLKYRFQRPELLHRGLVHRSFAHENPQLNRDDNETLEFLGDAVLNLAISYLLLERFPQCNEGDLSRMRSSIVNERELAKLAQDLDLGSRLLLGKGEELTGGRHKASLLADSLEALLGAVFLDGGMDAAMEMIERLFHDYIDVGEQEYPVRTLDRDYKTQLQEFTQGRFKLTPSYRLEAEEGPDHEKMFHMSVALGERILAHGSGKTKKEAQQEAAQKALEVLQESS